MTISCHHLATLELVVYKKPYLQVLAASNLNGWEIGKAQEGEAGRKSDFAPFLEYIVQLTPWVIWFFILLFLTLQWPENEGAYAISRARV